MSRVNLNARTEDGCTALFLAAQQDRLDVVNYLLNSAKGAAKLNIGAKGFSPLVRLNLELQRNLYANKVRRTFAQIRKLKNPCKEIVRAYCPDSTFPMWNARAQSLEPRSFNGSMNRRETRVK